MSLKANLTIVNKVFDYLKLQFHLKVLKTELQS